MSAAARTIIGQIKTQLANIDGTGGYVHDLSTSGQIVVGSPTSSPGAPRLFIEDVAIESSHDHNLGAYNRRLSCLMRGFVGTVGNAADSAEGRVLAALDLGDDIATALEADRSLGGNVLDLIVSISAINGDEIDWRGYGVVEVLLSADYIAQSGVGL